MGAELFATSEGYGREAPEGAPVTPPQRSLRVFGRLQETAALTDAYSRVLATNRSEAVLLSGPPGIGKSALVHRFQSLLRTGQHRFASGKSEHLQDGAVLAPILQALRSLVDAVLSEGDAALAEFKQRLAAGIGGNGRLIADLVPEAGPLIDHAPPLPELPVALAQSRLQRTILSTFAAFASAGRPLILFLDDLQWADASTSHLLVGLTAEPPTNILLLASYREEAAPQLCAPGGFVATLRDAPTPLTEISLTPISAVAAQELIANALDTETEGVEELATVIHARAHGNPFFIEHFVRRLLDEHVLHRSDRNGRWQWDRDRLLDATSGGDVLDFISGRLQRLNTLERALLATLAMLGGPGDVALLAGLLRQPIEAVDGCAAGLVAAGLLEENQDTYRFSHDRVLEAADLLTSAAEQRQLHTRIARLRLIRQDANRPEQMFAIGGSILKARSGEAAVSLKPGHRRRFAALLRDAAVHARAAGASGQSAAYLNTAACLVTTDWWHVDPALAFDLAYLRGESLLLSGDIAAADQCIADLLEQDLSDRRRAAAYRLLAALRTVQSDYEAAIAAALAGLTLMGHPLERSPSLEECRAAAERVCRLMGKRPVAMVDVPLASDPDIALTTSLLSTLLVCIFTGDRLRFVHLAKIVELTITHGVTADSAYGLAWYGVMISDFYARYADGFAYGQAALSIIDRHGFEGQRTGVLVAVDQLSAWTQPFEYALARVHDAIAAGRAAGDLAMTCFARNHLVSDLIQMGRPLMQVEAEAEHGLQLTRSVGFRDIEILLSAQQAFARRLRSGELRPVAEDLGAINSVSTRFWAHLYDGMAAYMFADHDRAAAAFAAAEPISWALPAHIDLAYFTFFTALNHAKHLPAREAIAAITPLHDRLAQWAELNPATFNHKRLLVAAEMARLDGDSLAALRLYDQAIEAAGGFVHERALARDLAGQHCASEGLDGLSRYHFREAAGDYRLWGADAKAQALMLPAMETEGFVEELLRVMETIRTIAQENELDALRAAVLRALMNHSGAGRGKLLLVHDGDLIIDAVGRADEDGIAIDIATMMPTPDRVDPELLTRAVQSGRPVLADLLVDADEDIAANGLKTVLCLPLCVSDHLVGIAYLEARPDSPANGRRYLDALRLLTSHAAVQLQRAESHARGLENHERRSQAESALRLARVELAQRSQLATMGGMAASIAHEINQPLATIVSHASAGARWLKHVEPNVAEALQNLAAIKSSGVRAAEIVAALRSLARQDTIVHEPVDLTAILNEVLELTRAEIDDRSVTLILDVPEDTCPVSGDRVQLQQLTVNLINNALDAMAEVPVADRQLLVSCRSAGARFVLRIEDRGCGMSDDMLAKVFTPLFTTKAKGMGMGLTICKSIVDAHRGELTAGHGSVGGTVFEISLPALTTD